MGFDIPVLQTMGARPCHDTVAQSDQVGIAGKRGRELDSVRIPGTAPEAMIESIFAVRKNGALPQTPGFSGGMAKGSRVTSIPHGRNNAGLRSEITMSVR